MRHETLAPSHRAALRAAAFVAAALVAAPGGAAVITWTDWTSATAGSPGSASGTMGGVGVAYSGEVFFAQTAGGTNYWVPGTPYMSATVDNAPPDSDIVTLVGGNSIVNTITFSAAVTNPVLAIVSLGQPSLPVLYDFDAPFDVLSFGPGYWGGPGTLTELPGDMLQGIEGHGAIQFQGSFTSINWTVPIAEQWHGFTVGVAPAAVPEPSALVLLGAGLLTIARSRRRRAIR